jgi:hypothetical protein
MQHPVLASDFTGLWEAVVWSRVAIPYVCLLLVCGILSLIGRARGFAGRMAKILIYGGALFVPVVVYQLKPLLRENGHMDARGAWTSLMSLGLVSAVLVLASYGLFRWCRHASRR